MVVTRVSADGPRASEAAWPRRVAAPLRPPPRARANTPLGRYDTLNERPQSTIDFPVKKNGLIHQHASLGLSVSFWWAFDS